MLRNLIEASESELRPHRLPALVADVQRIVADGSLDEINGFNRAQADDQQAKWAFLKAHPDLATVLFRLEDHPLLRGSLQAFDLDAATFAHRAAAFESLMAAPDGWRDLTGALLAVGNYARRRNDRDLQLGSPSNSEPWRNLLTGTSRANLRRTADALSKVLDAVAGGTAPRVSLRQMQDAFVRSREATGEFDWRYYLVRYDTMREGASGIYASVGGNMGYLVCMLDKTQMNGRYRDPYLAALARQAGADARILEGGAAGPVFAGGHVENLRLMDLPRSGAACTAPATDGFCTVPSVRSSLNVSTTSAPSSALTSSSSSPSRNKCATAGTSTLATASRSEPACSEHSQPRASSATQRGLAGTRGRSREAWLRT